MSPIDQAYAEILNPFGRAVRARRKHLGLSQEDLADASGLHRTYIGGVECGHRNLTLTAIAHLSAALEVQPSELLADAELLRERDD